MDRGFKALKQMTKMNFLYLHRPDESLKTYRELLSYTKSNVTRNYADKSINNILDYVAGEGKVGHMPEEGCVDALACGDLSQDSVGYPRGVLRSHACGL